MRNPFRYYKTSPDVIRLAVMMYVHLAKPSHSDDIYGLEASRAHSLAVRALDAKRADISSDLLTVPLFFRSSQISLYGFLLAIRHLEKTNGAPR